MVNRKLFHRQRDIRRHAHRQRAVAVVAAQTDFKRLDVALGAAHVALRGVIGIHAAIKHRAFARRAGRKASPHLVAKMNPVNVGFLNIRAHPKIVLD